MTFRDALHSTAPRMVGATIPDRHLFRLALGPHDERLGIVLGGEVYPLLKAYTAADFQEHVDSLAVHGMPVVWWDTGERGLAMFWPCPDGHYPLAVIS